RRPRRTKANSKVKLEPSTVSWENVAVITSPEEERRRDREERQHKGHAEQLRYPEEPELGDPGLENGDGGGQRDQLDQEAPRGQEDPLRRQLARDAPRHEQVAEEGEEDEQLHRRRPLDQRQVASRVFEDHGLVDHRELEMGSRVSTGRRPVSAKVTMKRAA